MVYEASLNDDISHEPLAHGHREIFSILGRAIPSIIKGPQWVTSAVLAISSASPVYL